MTLSIDIVSDVVCPWCFIGKRRLERALAEWTAPVAISWRPFQLNPDMPRDGMDRRHYMAAKFGAGADPTSAHARMAAIGRDLGIAFAFDRIDRTPNTLDAHRLIRMSTAQGLTDAVVEGLFAAYFTQGRDIGGIATLIAIGAAAGLEAAAVARMLEGEEGMAEVLAEDESARDLGIDAVPCFIFDRKYALPGAHEPATLLATLRKAAGPPRG